jgi:ABC-2 type transport system ATP-binding protein
MNDYAIATESLTKQYGNVTAVADLSLRVRRGEAFGFLGPNGAGKSTSLKMLVALVPPTSGTGAILGKPIGDRLVRERIGLLPEHFRFHEILTGRELLKFHGRLYGMSRREVQAQSDRLLLRVGLEDAADRPLHQYSKGMTQRLGLAQSLINRPDLVFWDEPTSALDPLGRLLVRDLIRELRDQGVTVFLNSHLLGEVENVCGRVAFVKQGRVIKDFEISKLPATQQVEVRIDRDANVLITEFARYGRVISVDNNQAIIEFANRETIPEFVRWLTTQNIGLYELQSKRVSLEELFVDTIGVNEESL